jgi:hypothetical protein
VGHEEVVCLGAGYNQVFAAALNLKGEGEYGNRLERGRLAAEDFLVHFPRHKPGPGGDFARSVGQCLFERAAGVGYGPSCAGVVDGE